MLRLLAILLIALPSLLAGAPSATAQAVPSCRFILGFQTLHDLDPAAVGDCLESQAFAANGDALQHTTRGLLAWRKADNFTAFTDGSHTWVNGPNGLQQRPNTQRFSWEANPAGLALAAATTIRTETIGASVEGRAITATQIGTASRVVAFVGDTHGGPEQETDWLIAAASTYFTGHPGEIPASVTAYFLPTINPDGLADGTRLNAHGVDLNRNWATSDWSPDANEPSGSVRGAGGPQPFSEPETQVTRDFLLTHHVTVSIFYHLPWGGIFPEPHSVGFAQQLAQSSGYPWHAPGQDTPYVMTGTAHRWADQHGESSVLLELRGGAGIEWTANYQAMLVALRFAAGSSN